MAESRRIVIVGGGVIGLGIACHLARLGVDDVLLLERNQLGSGTSWHAAGIVGPLRASFNLTRIASYACELFPALEAQTGQSTGFRQTGGYWLAREPARMQELKRIAAMGEISALDVEILSPDQLSQREPYLDCDGLSGALFVAQDGQANPVDVCMAYAKAARAGGVEIREGVACTDVETKDGAVHGVRLASGEHIRCEKLVNCAGAWAHHIGALAGVPVPLQAVEHMYIVTEPAAQVPDPFPIMRDLERGTYVKGDTGKLVLGGFEPDAKTWDACGTDGDAPYLVFPEDWDQFEPFMNAGLELVPALAELGIQHFMNGPETFTPDSRQLLGESPFLRNFFVAAGMNSTGMMSSAGIGKVMAEWVATGAAPMDLWEIDIARFDQPYAAPAYLAQRMREAVADVFAMHWPLKQPATGRNLRCSPLHEAWTSCGAVFGAPAGWERPLWFARNAEESEFHHSYGDQHWWPMAERESLAVRDAVGVFELTPFAKFEISGPHALPLLQQLCANDLDVPPGTLVYGQFLNARGGIEADVTVTRVDERSFRVIGGAATRFKDRGWMERQRERLGLQADVCDFTEAEAVIGVMGPRSRDLLRSLSDTDFADAAFPFATAQAIDVRGVPARANRISFAGELGWELYIPAVHAAGVHETIISAGQPFGLQPAGHLALDACRIEKGYRHWGHDIGADDTPLEAGLAFAVALDKPGGFLGRDALLVQNEQGVSRRLMLFAVDGAHPLLLHDEPIYRDGKLVARTTSGARGFRTGLSLCLGYLPCEPGETAAQLRTGRYEVGVAGERHRLDPLARVPYDPHGKRLRS